MGRAPRLLPLTALVVANMSACGGGDLNSSASASTLSVVTDSYFEYAKVRIDANNSGKCDSGEASTYTDTNGAYSLSDIGAITVEVSADAFCNGPGKGTRTATTQPLVFRAPAGISAIVSTISAELAVLMDSSDGDINATKTAPAARPGVTIDELLESHNKEIDADTKTALQTEIDQAIGLITNATANGGDIGKRLHDGVTKRMALADNVKTIVVIYAENHGFDSLYSLFPGASGIPGVDPTSADTAVVQENFDGSVLPAPPPTWGGATVVGQSVQIAQASTANMPNQTPQIDSPSSFGSTGMVVDQNAITCDLWYRFYQSQMQTNSGRNDRFAAFVGTGGPTMGYYGGNKMAIWSIARQYTLTDNFFVGVFDGSFLDHQHLICACTSIYPNAATSPVKGSITNVKTNANDNLTLIPTASSVTVGAPTSCAGADDDGNLTKDGSLAPVDNNGTSYAVNTMQPPYQLPGSAVASGNAAYVDPTKASTMPTRSTTNIDDLLTVHGVGWAWYAGVWSVAIVGAPNAMCSVIYSGSIQFQLHRQPFNYFNRFDPATATSTVERTARLCDYDAAFLQDAAAGKLPAVMFCKPQGDLNQHLDYASVAGGDVHIANVIARLQKSSQWKNMMIVVTYDENDGFYDHATMPRADRWDPGTRIPAIVVSPFTKKGFADHTQYDTASVLYLTTHRFDLPTPSGIKQRDATFVSDGNKPVGDLTNALDFTQAR